MSVFYRFNTKNGVRHAEYGVGIVIAVMDSMKYIVKFDSGQCKIVPEDSLESVPSRGEYRGGRSHL